MNAVEFTTELSGASILPIPHEAAAQLPKSGPARVIVLTDESQSAQWSQAAAAGLARAYSDDEPEYSPADVKP